MRPDLLIHLQTWVRAIRPALTTDRLPLEIHMGSLVRGRGAARFALSRCPQVSIVTVAAHLARVFRMLSLARQDVDLGPRELLDRHACSSERFDSLPSQIFGEVPLNIFGLHGVKFGDVRVVTVIDQSRGQYNLGFGQDFGVSLSHAALTFAFAAQFQARAEGEDGADVTRKILIDGSFG